MLTSDPTLTIPFQIVIKTKSPNKSQKNKATSFDYSTEENTEKSITSSQKSKDSFNHIPSFLQIKHPTNPFNLESQRQTYQKYTNSKFFHHLYDELWTDWKKEKNGLLTYKNQQKLSVQKSIVKVFFKKIIANLLKGRSVFSTSLPVTIFQNVSLVQKICKCLGYAPLAFEEISNNPYNSVSLKQRIKSILIMMIGLPILYIQQMAKPFNSVLGETYQGFINGCLVYAKQISHHPPITSFFMKGKGYCIYGSLQPTFSFQFNKVVGSNKGLVSVAFDNFSYTRNVMNFTFPNTQMGGLFVGDRTVQKSGLSYIFDQKDKIYSKIYWGPKQLSDNKTDDKKNRNSFADPERQDYMEGKVYKLKDSDSVNKENYFEIEDRSFESQLLQFNGNWTQSLYIGNKKQFDFLTQLPYQCAQYSYPLQSHSNLRDDIKFKRLGQIDKSQQAKQDIQNFQRNDRIMRQKYANNNNQN